MAHNVLSYVHGQFLTLNLQDQKKRWFLDKRGGSVNRTLGFWDTEALACAHIEAKA